MRNREKNRIYQRDWARKYRQKFPEKVRANYKKWWLRNSEKCRSDRRLWRLRNLEQCRESDRIRQQKRNSAKKAMTRRIWRENPVNKISANIRTRIWLALRGAAKLNSTQTFLGCPIDFLRGYLSVFFKPGMTWENYGKIWHIDHKRPCASFDLSCPELQKQCFHWTNLQPPFAQENLSKGAKII